jgi:type IV secretion system protein VirB10
MQDQDNQSTNFKLRSTPERGTRINKPLIIIICGIAAFILALVIINIFSEPAAKSADTTNGVVNNLKPEINPAIASLPQSYREKSAIQKYFVKPDAAIPASVQQELTVLRSQQSMLEQRLQAMQQGHITQEYQQDNMQLQQAKSSSIFFPGQSPPREEAVKSVSSTTQQTPSDDLGGKITQTAYDKQNMQLQKKQFIEAIEDKIEDIYNPHKLVTPISSYEIQAGNLIPSVLITAIDTSLPGEIIAQVRQNVYDSVTGQFLLIPKGSRLLGQYDSQIAYGQERVLIVFTRIIRPDGSSILLSKTTGIDMQGHAGMKGEVNNHWGKVLGAATLSTMLSVGAGIAADNNFNDDNTYYRSSRQNAVLGGTNSISQVGNQIANRAINVQPTLTIPAGYEFNVIVNKDMVLTPFENHHG